MRVKVSLDPAPFLRGKPFEGDAATPYPRAVLADEARLPGGTWRAASIPVGVRLEYRGDADAVVVAYRTETDDLGTRGEGAGRTFEVWAGDSWHATVAAELGAASVELPLPPGPNGATVYLPEGMRPTVLSLTPVNGTIEPAPVQPHWLAYGDSITEGWVASSPARSWTAQLGRRLQLDVSNLGYAGAARGELPSAEHLAGVPAAVITMSYGTNCWSTIPHTPDLLRAGLDAFLMIVRQGHPTSPVVVITPIVRPGAETTPNRVGATLADLRDAMAEVVQARIDDGDAALVLVDGRSLVDEGMLADGIHPGDEGHAALADRLAPVLARAVAGGVGVTTS